MGHSIYLDYIVGMKFVLAPDKYKGSLTGQQFCEAVASGIQKASPVPLA
ncbi:glycerate kinase [Flagellimonas taeanensis]|nr:glycerate kinase [Allomuricauda taeanensis]